MSRPSRHPRPPEGRELSARLGAPGQVGLLILRLWVGLNFALGHGLEKVRDPELFLESADMRDFPSYRVLGWCAILAQFVGGAFLAVGLQARLAAAAILATMAGAVWIVHGDDPWASQEFALTYAVILMFFVLHGAGSFSFDEYLDERRRRQSPW